MGEKKIIDLEKVYDKRTERKNMEVCERKERLGKEYKTSKGYA